MKQSTTPLRGEAHRGSPSSRSTREHWRLSAVILLALAVLAAVLIANGSSAAQAATPGTTDPATGRPPRARACAQALLSPSRLRSPSSAPLSRSRVHFQRWAK